MGRLMIVVMVAGVAAALVWRWRRSAPPDRITAAALRELLCRESRIGWDGPRWRLPAEVGAQERRPS